MTTTLMTEEPRSLPFAGAVVDLTASRERELEIDPTRGHRFFIG